jgi:valyl-tRNA synthetase
MWEGRVEVKSENSKSKIEQNFGLLWFENRLNEVKQEVENLMKQFQLSAALKVIYSLVWDDFCSWYLEWIKPGFEQPIEADIYDKTVAYFDELLQLLHPFMPIITEEIYHQLKQRESDLTIKPNPKAEPQNQKILEQGLLLQKTITTLREARAKNNLKPKEEIILHIQTQQQQSFASIQTILAKQINASAIYFVDQSVANTTVIAIESDKFYIESNKEVDTVALKEELLKDLQYQQGFLESVNKKLNNERFVANAKPEVVALEQAKKESALARIKTIEESLASL